jgi:hypothetical protein
MSNPLRVLIVEDSEDDLLLILRKLGMDIIINEYSMGQFTMPAENHNERS